MARDLTLLGGKLQRYREQFDLSWDEVAQRTGIPSASLQSYELGQTTPTGDEILIIASFYKCDYKFFLTNERLTPFEQTDLLFRRYGDVIYCGQQTIVPFAPGHSVPGMR